MGHDERPPDTEASYRFLHSTAEELAQLQPDELLQAVLEERTLLQVIINILNASDKDPILRGVSADLVYTQARQTAENQAAEAVPTTYDIKRVSLRLRPLPYPGARCLRTAGRGRRGPHYRPPVSSQERAAETLAL